MDDCKLTSYLREDSRADPIVVGSDFRPEFLDWLFDSAQRLIAPPPRDRERERDISPPRESRDRDRDRSPIRSRRLLDSALGGLGNNKRKSDVDGIQQNKRRISEGTSAGSGPISAPGGPRAMMGNEGRGLADRMGPRRGGMAVRGMGIGRGGMPMAGGGGKFDIGKGLAMADWVGFGFRGNGNGNGMMNQSQGFGSFFNPGQQEMMAQMMMMQANMAQMGEMMQHMVEVSFPIFVESQVDDIGEGTSTTTTGHTLGTSKSTSWNQTRRSFRFGNYTQTILCSWTYS
jgi:hypothetical protein